MAASRSTGGVPPVGEAIGPQCGCPFAPVPRWSGARARRGAKVCGEDRRGLLGAEDKPHHRAEGERARNADEIRVLK